MKYGIVAMILSLSTLTSAITQPVVTEQDNENVIISEETTINTEEDYEDELFTDNTIVEAANNEEIEDGTVESNDEASEDIESGEELAEDTVSDNEETSEEVEADEEADTSIITSDNAEEILETTPLQKYSFWYGLDKYPKYKLEAAQMVEDLMNGEEAMDEETACLEVINLVSDWIYLDTVNFFQENTDADFTAYEAWVAQAQQ